MTIIYIRSKIEESQVEVANSFNFTAENDCKK